MVPLIGNRSRPGSVPRPTFLRVTTSVTVPLESDSVVSRWGKVSVAVAFAETTLKRGFFADEDAAGNATATASSAPSATRRPLTERLIVAGRCYGKVRVRLVPSALRLGAAADDQANGGLGGAVRSGRWTLADDAASALP